MTEPNPEPTAEEATETETRAILAEAGATLVQVKRMPFGWSVASKEHGSGCTSDDPGEWRAGAFRDPRELARHMIETAGPDPQAPGPAQAGAAVQAMVADTDAAPADDLDDWLGSEVLDENEEAEQDSADEIERQLSGSASPGGPYEDLAEDEALLREGSANAYPGIAILPDELGARRNAVRAAISEAKLIRLDADSDPNRWRDLDAAFVEFQNLAALGQPISDTLAQRYGEYLVAKARREAIQAHADALERAARDADMDGLAAMARDLEQGWP